MSEKAMYEKPRAELLSFRLEDELMNAGATVGLDASYPTVGGGAGERPPFGETDALNDKSSYQLLD